MLKKRLDKAICDYDISKNQKCHIVKKCHLIILSLYASIIVLMTLPLGCGSPAGSRPRRWRPLRSRSTDRAGRRDGGTRYIVPCDGGVPICDFWHSLHCELRIAHCALHIEYIALIFCTPLLAFLPLAAVFSRCFCHDFLLSSLSFFKFTLDKT